MKRIVWLSANLFGLELLKEVYPNISAIITLSPHTKTVQYDGVDSKHWHQFHKPVYPIENINNEASLLRLIKADAIIMCGWRQVLSKEVLNIPQDGVIAFHPTLLPKGRGSAPIINTILEGLTISGVTAYYAKDGIDNGDIIAQESFNVSENDYAQDVYNMAIIAGIKLVKVIIPQLLKSELKAIPQDESEATYFPKRTPKDNEILASDSIELANRKIRAFSKPYLGAFIRQGNKKIIIYKGIVE